MITEHTNGPWKVSGEDTWGMGCRAIVDANGDPVAHVETWTDSPQAAAEALANANLIAAAPKLLAALKGVMDDLSWLCAGEGDDAPEVRWKEAHEAIKEAESQDYPEDEGSLVNLEKCEDCVHGDPQEGGEQAICTCPESTESIYEIRDILYRTGTCPFYAWKH